MDHKFAEHFAADWIDSWNAHDLNRILSHYTDDFEMASPVIIQVANEPVMRTAFAVPEFSGYPGQGQNPSTIGSMPYRWL